MGARGIAQVVVLWGLLLLGAMALSFSFAMRTEAIAARNGADSAYAYYMARTGILRAGAIMSRPPFDNVLREPIVGREEGGSYETTIVNESGKIDVNLVPEETLKEILRNAGLAPGKAEEVGDSILDWRDVDDIPRPNGAEDSYYAALPEPIRPRNGRLLRIEELLSVKGVDAEDYWRIYSKVFTVNGGSAAVNVNAAPAEVLRILPGFSQEAADGLVARRREAPFGNPASVAGYLADAGVSNRVLPLLSTFGSSNAYTILSTGKAEGGIVRSIACRVELRGTAGRPVRIVSWTDLVPSEEGGGKGP